MAQYFPLGWQHYLGGGVLIGIGVALIFLLVGVRAGASGFFTSSLGFVSKHAAFHAAKWRDERGWRAAFALGLVVGAAIFVFLMSGATSVTGVQWWRLGVGGVLVGYGTRLSRGCTSGHGICGMASLSRPSIMAVLVFLAVGIATAHGMAALGVAP